MGRCEFDEWVWRMAMYAWFPCMWVDEFGILMEALERAWTTIHAWGLIHVENRSERNKKNELGGGVGR